MQQDNNVNSKIDMHERLTRPLYRNAGGDLILYFGLEREQGQRRQRRRLLVPAGQRQLHRRTGGGDAWTGPVAGRHPRRVRVLERRRCQQRHRLQVGRRQTRWSLRRGRRLQAQHRGRRTRSGATTQRHAAVGIANDPVTTKWLSADATLGVGKTDIVAHPTSSRRNQHLTAVRGERRNAPSCFNTFIADTRSSRRRPRRSSTMPAVSSAVRRNCHDDAEARPATRSRRRRSAPPMRSLTSRTWPAQAPLAQRRSRQGDQLLPLRSSH